MPTNSIAGTAGCISTKNTLSRHTMNKLQSIALILPLLLPAMVQAEESEAPKFVVENGKVDSGTFNGWRRFHGTCHACHGQDAMGSSFAPALATTMKTMDYATFKKTVMEGRQVKDASGAVQAMPAFANDNNVTKHLDDLYRYVAARASGKLAPGRPEKLPK